MTKEEKENAVYNILLTPIKCFKLWQGDPIICLKDNVIYSTQSYDSKCLDEDMSDFSVGFYEIVYKDILKGNNGKILNDNGTYKNANYMGDTMHSFNSLANVILDNESKSKRSPKEKWLDKLIDYYCQYHCLANFWVIPMCHGRSLPAKLNRYDSLDAYLNRVNDWYSNNVDFRNNTDKYFQNFTDYKCYLGIHGMSWYEDKLLGVPSEIYKSKDKCFEEIDRIYSFWEQRAREIAKKYTNELYDYFDRYGLINAAETTN